MNDSKGEPSPRFLMTARQAASYLAISTRTLQKLSNAGQLPFVRLGGTSRKSVRYSPDTLQQWIKECEGKNA